jgi:aminopeptidase N
MWLNEGFTHLFQHILIDKIYPEMRIQDFMTITSMQEIGLQKDSDNTTHRMWYQTDTPAEIDAAFDHVSIQKCELK